MFADTEAVSERMADIYRTRGLRNKIRLLLQTLSDPSKCPDMGRPISVSSKLLYSLRRLKFLLRSEYTRSMWQMYNTNKKDLILTDPDSGRILQKWLSRV